MSIETIQSDAKKRMHGAIETLKKEMATIRTGRANASMLDTVHVEYYGTKTPLNQVATITVPESSMLVIQPFDRSAIKAIETGILESQLGLNPSNDGVVIRLPIPALNEERRRELVKVLHKLSEEIKTSIRNVRRDANDHVKQLEKNKDAHLSENAAKKALDDIQKLTDGQIKEVDDMVKHKEAEIMKI